LRAAELVFARIAGAPVPNGPHLVSTQLVIRDSCGCPPAYLRRPPVRWQAPAPELSHDELLDNLAATLLGVVAPDELPELAFVRRQLATLVDGFRTALLNGDVAAWGTLFERSLLQLAPLVSEVSNIQTMLAMLQEAAIMLAQRQADPVALGERAARLIGIAQRAALVLVTRSLIAQRETRIRAAIISRDITLQFLTMTQDQMLSLEWLQQTAIGRGYLFLYHAPVGMLEAPGPLHLAGAYVRDGASALAPGISCDTALFPPAALLGESGAAPLGIFPVSTANQAYGVLCLVAAGEETIIESSTSGVWAAQLAVLLERAALVEAALREHEELYRLITENSSDLIGMLDQAGRLVYASPSYQRLLGYDPAYLVGASLFDLLSPDDLDIAREWWRQIDGQGRAECAFRARHVDGAWRWIESSGAAIVREGAPYVVSVGRDVTARRQLEAQLLQAQKVESVGRLAGGVAHDFNNLLTAITGYVELAIDALPANNAARDDLGEVQKAAQRAMRLTSQLLAFARKQIIAPHILDLNDLIIDLERMLHRLIGEHIELITLPGADPALIRADPGQIEQVLVNLAVNACDAMPGGGKLTIGTANISHDDDAVRRLSGIVAGDALLLTVSDTGAGMSAEVQEHLFEPFFTTKGVGQGAGLGLAMCYGIVKQHGGAIMIQSAVNQGTTVSIYLPRAEGSVAVRPPPEEGPVPPRGTETILLVEDEAQVRALVVQVLRALGYTVIEAAHGEDALRQFEALGGARVDLLLTDVVMPLMGGPELAQRLVALCPNIKVLFISGYTGLALSGRDQSNLPAPLLHKPFAPAELARKVREVLDG
jgi:PAS domain S-box-containing protein